MHAFVLCMNGQRTNLHVSIFKFSEISIRTYTYTRIHRHTHTYTKVLAWIDHSSTLKYLYIHTHTHKYIYIYIYIYTHTHTQVLQWIDQEQKLIGPSIKYSKSSIFGSAIKPCIVQSPTVSERMPSGHLMTLNNHERENNSFHITSNMQDMSNHESNTSLNSHDRASNSHSVLQNAQDRLTSSHQNAPVCCQDVACNCKDRSILSGHDRPRESGVYGLRITIDRT
jgi:hypothetical protein